MRLRSLLFMFLICYSLLFWNKSAFTSEITSENDNCSEITDINHCVDCINSLGEDLESLKVKRLKDLKNINTSDAQKMKNRILNGIRQANHIVSFISNKKYDDLDKDIKELVDIKIYFYQNLNFFYKDSEYPDLLDYINQIMNSLNNNIQKIDVENINREKHGLLYIKFNLCSILSNKNMGRESQQYSEYIKETLQSYYSIFATGQPDYPSFLLREKFFFLLFHKDQIKKINNSLLLEIEKQIKANLENVKANPKNAWLYFQRGDIYYEQKRYKESSEEYKKAIELDNENGWFLRHYSQALAKQNNKKDALSAIEKAQKYFQQLNDIKKPDGNFYSELASLLAEAGRTFEANKFYDEAIKRDDFYWDYSGSSLSGHNKYNNYKKKAELCLNINDPKSALKIIEDGITDLEKEYPSNIRTENSMFWELRRSLLYKKVDILAYYLGKYDEATDIRIKMFEDENDFIVLKQFKDISTFLFIQNKFPKQMEVFNNTFERLKKGNSGDLLRIIDKQWQFLESMGFYEEASNLILKCTNYFNERINDERINKENTDALIYSRAIFQYQILVPYNKHKAWRKYYSDLTPWALETLNQELRAIDNIKKTVLHDIRRCNLNGYDPESNHWFILDLSEKDVLSSLGLYETKKMYYTTIKETEKPKEIKEIADSYKEYTASIDKKLNQEDSDGDGPILYLTRAHYMTDLFKKKCMIYENFNKYDEALKSINQAFEWCEKSDFLSLLFQRAYLYEKMGHIDNAKKDYREIVNSAYNPNPQESSDLIVKLQASYQLGDKHQVNDMIKILYTLESHEVSTHLVHSQIHIQNKENKKAISLLQEAQKRFPSDHKIQLLLAHAYMNMEQYKKAYIHLEAARKLSPKDDVVLQYCGDFHLDRGNYQEAMKCYNSIKNDPIKISIKLYLKKLITLIKMKEFGQAKSIIDELLAIDGMKNDAYLNGITGILSLQCREYEKAYTIFSNFSKYNRIHYFNYDKINDYSKILQVYTQLLQSIEGNVIDLINDKYYMGLMKTLNQCHIQNQKIKNIILFLKGHISLSQKHFSIALKSFNEINVDEISAPFKKSVLECKRKLKQYIYPNPYLIIVNKNSTARVISCFVLFLIILLIVSLIYLYFYNVRKSFKSKSHIDSIYIKILLMVFCVLGIILFLPFLQKIKVGDIELNVDPSSINSNSIDSTSINIELQRFLTEDFKSESDQISIGELILQEMSSNLYLSQKTDKDKDNDKNKEEKKDNRPKESRSSGLFPFQLQGSK